jgi:hypothetical protein
VFLILGFFLISNKNNTKSQNFKSPKDETLSTSIENTENQSQLSDEDPFEQTVLRQQSFILEKLIQLNKIEQVE